MVSTTTRHVLPNGLIVLLKEIHTAPLISHWIWYRVGSYTESPGITGASHWVEHMQFKGTPRFPAGVLDRDISRLGGYWNAFTYLDWTAYFETLPAGSIDLALELEADRMVGSLFEDDEVESERSVIISERLGNENEPTFRLAEAVQRAAFKTHPYRHEVIGDLADLESMTRQDLYHHYNSHYLPNNAVLALAGDFDTSEMLGRVRKLYEPIPAGEKPPVNIGDEPPQADEQHVEISGEGETTYIQISYHAPQGSHADFLPLAVLDSLLSGPSDLSVFGGGLSNTTSRLYQSLVERELAVSVHGGLQATCSPFLYHTDIILHPDSEVEPALAAFDGEIERLQETPTTQAELSRAVKQARALFAYNSESITNQAAWMGFAEMFASQDWLESYLVRLEQVTPHDVQDVACRYLQPVNRVVGVFHPEEGAQS